MALPAGSVLRLTGRLLLLPLAAVAGIGLAALLASPSEERVVPIPSTDVPIGFRRVEPIPELMGDVVVSGIVVSGEERAGAPTAQAIPDAVVRVSSGFVTHETKGNEFGRFEVRDLPRSPITIVAMAPGFRPATVGPLEPGGRETVVKLTPIEEIAHRFTATLGAPASVVVQLGMPEGLPAPALQVALVPDGDVPLAGGVVPLTRDAVGAPAPEARFERIPPGRYRAIAIPAGASADARSAYADVSLVLDPGETEQLRLEPRWTSLSGKVTSQGSPVERAFVRAVRMAEARPEKPIFVPAEVELRRAVTERDGSFRLDGLPIGKLTLEVLVAGHSPWTREVRSGAGEPPVAIDLDAAKPGGG